MMRTTTVDRSTATLVPRGRRGHPVLPGGLGRSTFAVGGDVPVAVRGAGARLWDADGNELIDLNANFTTLIHGHAHPRIVRAAQRATAEGASFGLPNRAEMRHAEALLERMPDYDQVRYANSGSEAIATALRVARAATGRDKAAFVRRAYHGTSDNALVAGPPAARRGVSRGVLAETLTLPINDVAALERAVAEHGSDLAALVIDRLPNRAGLIPLTADYVTRARELCDRHGIVLVGDEVVSFRLAVGGIAGEHGVVPDLVTLGKLIGGGHPVGAVVGRADLMSEFDPDHPEPLEHGGTFNGNPVSMEAGRAALELLDGATVAALNERCERARTRLAVEVGDRGWVVRGRGSLFRLFPAGADDDPATWQRELWWEAYRRGVLLMQTALAAVPTVLDERDLDFAVEQVAAAALTVSQRLGTPALRAACGA
jgi:glutamate-1-semialdehyde 2,1-aminomutase